MTKTKHYGWALALICTAQMMVILDATITNIALPHIQTTLGFSQSSLSWIITAYSLIFAGFLLLGGRVGDLFGRRRAFMFGLLLFAAASLVGGFAQNETMLLGSRAVQGLGAAFASPNALALITTTFEPGPRRSRAFAVYGMMSGLGAAIGLVLGGWLTSLNPVWFGHLIEGWRFTFLINVPIGIVAALAAPALLEESDRHAGELDVPGAITATLGLVSLVYGITHAATNHLVNGQQVQYGWTDTWTLLSLGAGMLLLAAFIAIESRVEHPLLPFRILGSRDRNAAYTVMLFTAAAMFANFFFLTLLFQNVMGIGAMSTGFRFLPWSITMIIAAMIISRVVQAVDPGKITAFGGFLAGIGMFGLSRVPFNADPAQLAAPTASDYWLHIFPWIVIAPIGMACMFIPTTMSVVHRVSAQDSGIASGILNTMQQVGGSLGLAVLSTVAIHYAHTKAGDIAAAAARAGAKVDPTVVGHVAFTYGGSRGFIVGGIALWTAAAISLLFNRIHHDDLATAHTPVEATAH